MSTEVKPTPGPWRVDASFEIPSVIAACFPKGATCVAVVYGASRGELMARVPGNDTATLANANLIAAAPDLYEAGVLLKAAVSALVLSIVVGQPLGNVEANVNTATDAMIAALQKAEGR